MPTMKAPLPPSASPFGFAEPSPPATYTYKVGNTIPKAVHNDFEPFTFQRWNELGSPLVALQRSKFRANGERFYTLCKIMRFASDCTYWLLEDVPNSMASATPNKGVLDENAEGKGRLLISPYPDKDPIFGMDVPIVKGESMRAAETGAKRAASGGDGERPAKRAAGPEEKSTEDEVTDVEFVAGEPRVIVVDDVDDA